MPKPILWSPLSEDDFANILDYLDKHWGNNKRKRVRKCVLTKHNSLFYRNMNSSIEILRIYDSRQDPNTLKFN